MRFLCSRIGSIQTHVFAMFGLLLACDWASAYDANPAPGTDLSGYWRLNEALSDDGEAMLQKRLEEERKQRERWMRRAREQNPLGLPPLDGGLDDEPNAEPHAPGAGQPPSAGRSRREDPLRRMLGQTRTLEITQSGSNVQIVSDAESRRFEAGSRSQVSMPEGELANAQVGWDGEWFVVERRVSGGPRALEKFRLLKKTGQLEYQIAWSGDHLLAGIKVRRIFERAAKSAAPPDPVLGPVR